MSVLRNLENTMPFTPWSYSIIALHVNPHVACNQSHLYQAVHSNKKKRNHAPPRLLLPVITTVIHCAMSCFLPGEGGNSFGWICHTLLSRECIYPRTKKQRCYCFHPLPHACTAPSTRSRGESHTWCHHPCDEKKYVDLCF